ncbi:MAG: nickel pincer cofactor biosynthesis protein LarB [Bacillota bacterium]
MDQEQLMNLLQEVRDGKIDVTTALTRLRSLPLAKLESACVDTHRTVRTGLPEVVFCQGERPEHVCAIVKRLAEECGRVLVTRAGKDIYEYVRVRLPEAQYNELARIIRVERKPVPPLPGKVLIASAGTADLPVAEEAIVTATAMGCNVQRLYDVGVAGLHRLLSQQSLLYEATVIVVVAGMDGALPSVVGGLVDKPVIAVPSSVGYGASFYGLAALLTMLNSCAAGVAVVNIDNGFGAGYLAATICRSVRRDGPAKAGSPGVGAEGHAYVSVAGARCAG